MLLKKGFKYRLEPTSGQRQLFSQFAGASRFLYNRGLEQRKTLYEKEGKSITYFAENNELVSLKKDESTNWLKAKIQLSKLHARIRHCREDFAHKLSTMIVKNHDIICVEGLDIASLLEKSSKPMSRSIADASWRLFLRCLAYKSKEQGKYFVETGKYFPSTQLCSGCFYRNEMKLSDREYRCSHCSLVIERDLNSAIVEKAAGMSVLKACGVTPLGAR